MCYDITYNYWPRLSKTDLSVASKSIICPSRRPRQIIDLRDVDKSRYCAMAEFNDCFIVRPPLLSRYSHCSFGHLKMSGNRSAIFKYA